MSLGLSALEWEAVRLSLWVSGWGIVASLPLALALAWLLARRSFPGKVLLEGLVHLPLVLPPVVIGYLLLVLLGRRGVIGAWLFKYLGVTLAFSWQGAAVAAAVLAFPLMVRAMRLSLEAVDPRLEAAARTLGANPWWVFLSVTLPLSLPGVLSGVVLAFARGLGEFGATITFVSNIPGQTRTLPLAIYTMVQSPGGEEAALRLCIISVLLSLGALLISEITARDMRRRLRG